MLAPTVIWVSPWTVAGCEIRRLHFGDRFGNTSVAASLARRASGAGRSADGVARSACADLFVQPVWLGWTNEHSDFALGYGFYAPTGKYDTEIGRYSRRRAR